MNLKSKLNSFYSPKKVQNSKAPETYAAGTEIEILETEFRNHRQNHQLQFATATSSLQFSPEATVSFNDILFFDVECVSLGFGQNNIPYLIGCAFFTGESLKIQQIFSPNLFAEANALDFLEKLWRRFSIIISYNGKAFDIPLIKSRYELYRKTINHKFIEHHDLYHLLKKIHPHFRHRLIDVEDFFLDVRRQNDLSGEYSGQAYYEFLHFRNRELLDKIIFHNQQDLESLAAILLKINQLAENQTTIPHGAPKLYKLNSDLINSALAAKGIKDGEDFFYLGESSFREKKYRLAARYFLKSYRLGYTKGAEPLCRALKKTGKTELLRRLANYLVQTSEANIQKKILPYL